MKRTHFALAAIVTLALSGYTNADTVDLSEAEIDGAVTAAQEIAVKPRALKGVRFFNFVDSLGEPMWPVELEVQLTATNGQSFVACKAIQCLLLTSNSVLMTAIPSWSL